MMVIKYIGRSGSNKRSGEGNVNLCSETESMTYTNIPFRTIFIIYLFNTVQTAFFCEKPRISPYEIDLELPSHEVVFNCRTLEDWQSHHRSCLLSKLRYPRIFAGFISKSPSIAKLRLSVMGGFIVLHGK